MFTPILESPRFKPFLIGIAGGTGSGKSFFTEQLVSSFGRQDVAVLDCDSYYRDNSRLPLEARDAINFDHPDSIDHDLLYSHVNRLLNGHSIGKPVYDFAQHARSSAFNLVASARIIVVEGIFALWEERLRSLTNFKIFVDAAADLRFIRRAQRDILRRGRTMDSIVRQYLDSVRPMHQAHIEPTKRFADLVLDNSGQLDLLPLLGKVHSRVAQHFSFCGHSASSTEAGGSTQLVAVH
jgi:uridine kinase